MKNYELVYVVKPNSDDETKESVLNKIKDVISSNGEVEKVDTWGNKKLAYQIAKFTEGFYVLVRQKLKNKRKRNKTYDSGCIINV